MIFDVIFTVFKLVHPLNVPSLIEVTPDGIVMAVNDSHPKKAKLPIDFTEDGMIIDVIVISSYYFQIVSLNRGLAGHFVSLSHPPNSSTSVKRLQQT